MSNRGFGVVEIMEVLVLLTVLTLALRDALAAFASFLVSGIM